MKMDLFSEDSGKSINSANVVPEEWIELESQLVELGIDHNSLHQSIIQFSQGEVSLDQITQKIEEHRKLINKNLRDIPRSWASLEIELVESGSDAAEPFSKMLRDYRKGTLSHQTCEKLFSTYYSLILSTRDVTSVEFNINHLIHFKPTAGNEHLVPSSSKLLDNGFYQLRIREFMEVYGGKLSGHGLPIEEKVYFVRPRF